MKTAKIITILAMTALVSCQGLLEEKKTTTLSQKDVYATEESLEACISGCYSVMGSGQGWKGGMFEFLQEASGLPVTGEADNRTIHVLLDALN